jgi:phosphopantetheinyl transferase (holo-ACP synthase)
MNSIEKLNFIAKNYLYSSETFFSDVRKSWGSENPNYRTEIRKGILEYLKLHHPEQVADSIWDLDAPPILKSMFVSISHCNGMGGFVLCSKSIGFDIEEKSRISEKIIERVSTPEELSSCPDFGLLWPAKEAIFKNSTEFYTISHIQVSNWQLSQNGIYNFTSLSANGSAFLDQDHLYAIAFKKSLTLV